MLRTLQASTRRRRLAYCNTHTVTRPPTLFGVAIAQYGFQRPVAMAVFSSDSIKISAALESSTPQTRTQSTPSFLRLSTLVSSPDPNMVDCTDPGSQDAMQRKKFMQRVLLTLNILALAVGGTAGPILSKLYFAHGGSRRWFIAWLQSAGWPILVLPLWISRAKQPDRRLNHVSRRLFAFCCGVGVLTGLSNFMYTSGVPYLPVSTSALLIASQLAFNAVFAFLLVRQKFTPYSINSVVLLTAGSVLLSFHANRDKAKGVTHGQYVQGFVMTIGAAALAGLALPIIQLIYKTAKCEMTYALVVEMQLVMSASATIFCTVGMLGNGDFQAIHREAGAFRLGEVKYYVAIVWNAIAWQLLFIGTSGVIFLTSSLMSAIIIAVLIPVTQILGVLIFHDKFSGEKAMAMLLALWGFASYLYGEYTFSNIDIKQRQQSTLPERDEQAVDVRTD